MKRNHDALKADNERIGALRKAVVWGTAVVALAGGGVAAKGYVEDTSQKERQAQNQGLNRTAGEFADIILSQYGKGEKVEMREAEGGDLLGGLTSGDYRDGTVTVRYSDKNPSQLDIYFSADVVGVYTNGNGTPIDVSEIATFEAPYAGDTEAGTEGLLVQDLEEIVDKSTLTGISITNTPTDESIKGESANFGLKLNSGTGKFEPYSIGSLGVPNVPEIIAKADSFNKNLTN